MLNPNAIITVVLLFLPLVIGGAVFGWMLASRPEGPTDEEPIPGAVAPEGM